MVLQFFISLARFMYFPWGLSFHLFAELGEKYAAEVDKHIENT